MYSAALARLLKKAKPANATTSNAPSPMASRVALPGFKVFSLLIGLDFDRFIGIWRLLARIPHCKSQKNLVTLKKTPGRPAWLQLISDLRAKISPWKAQLRRKQAD